MKLSSPIHGVFLVGCARSGTTLLQSLLTSHPQITSFPESKFFLGLVPNKASEPRRFSFGISSRRTTPKLKKFLREIEHPELIESLPRTPLFMGQYTRKFVGILNQLARVEGKSIWLEKTPEHLRYIDYIEKFIPKAKIIHIIRNGSDVIASLYDLGQRYPFWAKWGFDDIDVCINTWTEAIRASRNHLHKPNHFFVHYEDLVADTPAVLKDLCKFLGIEFCEEMMRDHSNAVEKLARGWEFWKIPVKGDIRSTNSQKFYQLFDAEQQQYILSRLAGISLRDVEES